MYIFHAFVLFVLLAASTALLCLSNEGSATMTGALVASDAFIVYLVALIIRSDGR